MEIGIVETVTPSASERLPVLSGLIEAKMVIGGTRLAQAFWESPAHEQVAFFNFLGTLDRLPFQLHDVARNLDLTAHGRVAMQTIGEYGGAYES